MLLIAGTLSLLIWVYLLLGRGQFWRIPAAVNGRAVSRAAKRVAVIVPARNEASLIGEAIGSLLRQEFPTPVQIILVDDSSEDETARIAGAAAKREGRRNNLIVVNAGPLPPGWTGKLWALSQGLSTAVTLTPDYLLFTDADIHHCRHSVATLVSLAEASNLDLCSFMVKLHCESLAEKALIPAFVYFFLQLYPPAWIASERHRTAGAAGGCILIRPSMLEEIGGLNAIRGEVIDDCALARHVKAKGGKIWLGLTPGSESVRHYRGFRDIGAMISRSAFNQLRHSTPLLLGTVLALLITYLLPPLLLFSGSRSAALLGCATWLLMSVSYAPMVRFYRLPFIWALALPIISLFFLGATVHSAVRYWQGKGGAWKGRVQDR